MTGPDEDSSRLSSETGGESDGRVAFGGPRTRLIRPPTPPTPRTRIAVDTGDEGAGGDDPSADDAVR